MVDLDRIMLGDKSLSAREIWGAEYQENVCVLIKKENIDMGRDFKLILTDESGEHGLLEGVCS